MRTFDLETIVTVARGLSPFYRSLYSRLPREAVRLQDLPIVDSASFEEANSVEGNQILTRRPDEGVVFKTRSRGGRDQFTYYTRSEWTVETELAGINLVKNGFRAGDRVANMLSAAELDSGLLFLDSLLAQTNLGLMRFPLPAHITEKAKLEILREFKINILCGSPATLKKLAEFVTLVSAENVDERALVRRIFFAAEFLSERDRLFLSLVFPNASIRSLGYIHGEMGTVAYCDRECGPGEFRCLDGPVIVEILAEGTGQPIEEVGQPGLVVVTKLTRRLMPFIRVPAGEWGAWREPQGAPNRKFALLDQPSGMKTEVLHP